MIRENAWRETYNAVVNNPRRFGIPWDAAIVDDLQLAMDETPLQYVPKFSGAFSSKSHLCNPGDQLPNPSMRKYIQDRIRERAVKHGILVHTKVVPSRTKLDESERTMKKLLLRWIGEWMHIAASGSQITASWRMCLDQTPIAGSVDEIEIPRGVICLGPPVELRPVVEEREEEEPVVPEAPEPEPGEDAEPAPAAAPRLDDPFAVDVAVAAATAVPSIRRRTTRGVARERNAR